MGTGFKKDGKFRPTRNSKNGISMDEFNKSGHYFEGEIKRRAEKGSPYFFDKDTMRYFSSKVSGLMWQVGDPKNYQTNDIYFITSEQDKGRIKHSGSVRGYTIRKISADGEIDTVSEFQEFSSLNDAKKELKEKIGSGANTNHSKYGEKIG